MTEVVDYAFTTVNERALAAAGKTGAGRYVGPGSAGKHLTAAEVIRLHAAGLSIWLNVEGAAGDATAGWSLGIAHARQAEAARTALGAPPVPLYFAVDFDVTAGQWPSVKAYLGGAATVVGVARVGIYGGYNAVVWAARDKVAAWFFQTYAWSGGRWFAGNHLEQYHNGVSLAGGTVDLGRAVQANYGQWAPAGAPPSLARREVDMPGLFQIKGNDTLYLSDGFRRKTLTLQMWTDFKETWGNVPIASCATQADLDAIAGPDWATLAAGVAGPTAAQIATAVVDEEHARLAD